MRVFAALRMTGGEGLRMALGEGLVMAEKGLAMTERGLLNSLEFLNLTFALAFLILSPRS